MANLDNDPSLASQRSASSGSDFTHLKASADNQVVELQCSHLTHQSYSDKNCLARNFASRSDFKIADDSITAKAAGPIAPVKITNPICGTELKTAVPA